MRPRIQIAVVCLVFSSLLATSAHADVARVQNQAAHRGVKVSKRVTLRSALRLYKRHTLKAELRAMELGYTLNAMTSPLEYGTGPDYIEFRRVVGAAAVGKRALAKKRVAGTRRDVAQVYRASVRYGLAEVMDMAQSHLNAAAHGISAKTLAKDARRLLPRVDDFLANVDLTQLLRTEKALLVDAKKARAAIAERASQHELR